jgi:hypothetical protein
MSASGMDEAGERRHWHFGYWLVLAVAAYVTSFVVLLVCERVFGPNLWSRFPDEFVEVLQAFYAPILYLFRLPKATNELTFI